MKNSIIAFFLSFGLCWVCKATHLRGGEIRIEQVSSSSLTYRITVFVYVNTIGTNVLFGGDDAWLDFGDGKRVLVPETPADLNPGTSTGLSRASFSIEHTYAGYQRYVVTYSEPNRSEGIVNMPGSVNNKFFLESAFTVNPPWPQYYSPVNFVEPALTGFVGQFYSCAITCYDRNNYHLSYELVTPQIQLNTPPPAYSLPPGLKLNMASGLLTWDLQSNSTTSGIYSVAVKISQFNDDDELIGWIVKDYEIGLLENGPKLTMSPMPGSNDNDLLLTTGEVTEKNVAGIAINNLLSLKVYSELMTSPSSIEWLTSDSLTNDFHFIKGVATIRYSESKRRRSPYAIVIRATSASVSVDDVYLVYTTSLPVVTSISDIRTPEAFPNPTQRFIRFSTNQTFDKIELWSISGECYNLAIQDSAIDLEAIPNGVYFLSAFSGNTKYVFRVVKNN